ncbi:Holliday junction branch migration protein RuvA [Niabella drilacis]|uniref:Holliday junction branch migration complex subunit RuvA n=1 Tax=Niabella drilacis (strain DSM 25811 / CCM 8410 / CCUG 62505 / LMG 26954 / E90) TaxID=1285928 RepID=A0A1G6KVX5_NIADE|nr:Holliday junction branch migration protein RuvA [Niabella drilacis]SDC35252.1 Holliday junction DNA helicase subunit RuvA [Niabella drilacis]
MYAYLKGSFVSKTPSSVIIDVNGVGYEVHISLNTYSKIETLKEGLLFTHLIIREDAQLLYGFAESKERDIFLGLVSVSGIGAGTARLILSYMKPDEIVKAITYGDAKSLERIKGIGKKTAERAVLELKDKLGKLHIDLPVALTPAAAPSVRQDAAEALQALGIQRAQAEQAVQKVLALEPEISLEQLVKKALKGV